MGVQGFSGQVVRKHSDQGNIPRLAGKGVVSDGNAKERQNHIGGFCGIHKGLIEASRETLSGKKILMPDLNKFNITEGVPGTLMNTGEHMLEIGAL